MRFKGSVIFLTEKKNKQRDAELRNIYFKMHKYETVQVQYTYLFVFFFLYEIAEVYFSFFIKCTVSFFASWINDFCTMFNFSVREINDHLNLLCWCFIMYKYSSL